MRRPRFPGCQKATPWQGWPDGAERLLVEPKFSGRRLFVMVDDDGVVSFHSGSYARPNWAENLGHIAQAIRATGVRGAMFDGVLLAKVWDQTDRLICRKRSNMEQSMKNCITEEVRFHAYDCIPLDVAIESRGEISVVPVPFSERRALLEFLVDRTGSPRLRIVPQFEVFSPAQFFRVFDGLIAMDLERAVAKFPGAPYAFGRTDYWQDVRPMATLEMTISGATRAHSGKNLRSFECVREDGLTEIRCQGGFSDFQRERLWSTWVENPSHLRGRVIEAHVRADRVATARSANFLRFL